jgi:hypothetical protein
MATNFPSRGCTSTTTWVFIGNTWRQVDDTLTGGCTYAVHFKNGQREFLVRPVREDAAFQDIVARLPHLPILDGLSQEDTAALWSKFPEDVKPIQDPKHPGQRAFTLPEVRPGQVVDITPGPTSTPLTDEIRKLIFGDSQ